MATVILARENMLKALDTLDQAIQNLETVTAKKEALHRFMDEVELEKTFRDSLIKRFEYCTDLFWKYLRKYEKETLQMKLELITPRIIITSACKVRFLTENEATLFLEMMECHNITSHTYKEEVAEQIRAQIPTYATAMRRCIEKTIA